MGAEQSAQVNNGYSSGYLASPSPVKNSKMQKRIQKKRTIHSEMWASCQSKIDFPCFGAHCDTREILCKLVETLLPKKDRMTGKQEGKYDAEDDDAVQRTIQLLGLGLNAARSAGRNNGTKQITRKVSYQAQMTAEDRTQPSSLEIEQVQCAARYVLHLTYSGLKPVFEELAEKLNTSKMDHAGELSKEFIEMIPIIGTVVKLAMDTKEQVEDAADTAALGLNAVSYGKEKTQKSDCFLINELAARRSAKKFWKENADDILSHGWTVAKYVPVVGEIVGQVDIVSEAVALFKVGKTKKQAAKAARKLLGLGRFQNVGDFGLGTDLDTENSSMNTTKRSKTSMRSRTKSLNKIQSLKSLDSMDNTTNSTQANTGSYYNTNSSSSLKSLNLYEELLAAGFTDMGLEFDRKNGKSGNSLREIQSKLDETIRLVRKKALKQLRKLAVEKKQAQRAWEEEAHSQSEMVVQGNDNEIKSYGQLRDFDEEGSEVSDPFASFNSQNYEKKLRMRQHTAPMETGSMNENTRAGNGDSGLKRRKTFTFSPCKQFAAIMKKKRGPTVVRLTPSKAGLFKKQPLMASPNSLFKRIPKEHESVTDKNSKGQDRTTRDLFAQFGEEEFGNKVEQKENNSLDMAFENFGKDPVDTAFEEFDFTNW